MSSKTVLRASSGARTLDTLIKRFLIYGFNARCICIMLCDGNCFECCFPDCILCFEDGSLTDLEVETSLHVDDILFKKDASSIEVPDYRQYPFIPSEKIPYNPKWKSQAKWREYYRSRARGNRKEKAAALAKERRQNNKEKYAARDRKYYKEHREERLAYGKEYRKNNAEKIAIVRRECYLKNREKYLEYRKKYYEEHREQISAYRKKYYEEHREQISAYQKKYYNNKKQERNNLLSFDGE